MSRASHPYKPTRAEVQAAYDQQVPDIIGPHLQVLFCGINASLYSAAVGHHFARPGNRLWKALHQAGFTDRLLAPHEDQTLLELGYGMTNLVARATARADELSRAELLASQPTLRAKLAQFQPRYLAILGITAYRTAFQQPKAQVGPQPELGNTRVWVLPNPSGLNAHYQLDDLARVYGALLKAISHDVPYLTNPARG